MQSQVEPSSQLVKPLFKKSRKKRWIYSGVAAVVVLGTAIPLVMHQLSGPTALPTSTIYTVGYGTITQTVSASGTIQPAASVNLNFQGSGGLLKKVDVTIGQQVTAGQVLAQVDDTTAKVQLIQAQASVTQAQANLATAQTKLTQTEAGATAAQLFADQQAVKRAQLTLNQAQNQYQAQVDTFNNPTSEQQQIQNAQYTYQQAQQSASDTSGVTAAQQQLSFDQTTLQQDQINLSNAQTQYNNAVNANATAPTTATASALASATQALQQAQQTVNQENQVVLKDQNAVNTATKQLQQAQQQVAQDKLTLDTLQQQFSSRTADKQALASAQNQVAQDQLALQSAQETLQVDQQPPDAATLQQAEASVTTAQASLQNAQAQLQSAQQSVANTTMVAPISGVVSQVNSVAGEIVSGSSPFIVVTDTNKSDLQVNIQVSEAQIGSIKVNDPVQLTVAAYPGKSYTGTISQLYPTPTVSSNVTEYTVIATVNNSSGDLKDGMTASVGIQTAKASQVLTVPAIALQQFGTREGVYVVDAQSGSSSGNAGSGSTAGNGGSNGQGNSNGGANGNGGFGGSQSRNGTAGNGGNGGNFGGGSGSFAGSGKRGSFGTATTGLPKNVHFQPVQVGLFGTNEVEITRGLTAGEKILIELPAQAATAAAASSSSNRFGFGGGGPGAGAATRAARNAGGNG